MSNEDIKGETLAYKEWFLLPTYWSEHNKKHDKGKQDSLILTLMSYE